MTDSGKLSVLHMVTTGLSIVDDNIEDGTYNSKIRALAALGSVVSHERAAILEALKEKAEREDPEPLTEQQIRDMRSKAFEMFDEWNDASGAMGTGTSWYSEMKCVLIDVVDMVCKRTTDHQKGD